MNREGGFPGKRNSRSRGPEALGDVHVQEPPLSSQKLTVAGVQRSRVNRVGNEMRREVKGSLFKRTGSH